MRESGRPTAWAWLALAVVAVWLLLAAPAGADISFAAKFGSGGSGAGDLNSPSGIAVGSGNVYVSDTGNNRMAEFSAAGVFTKAWGWSVVDFNSQFETCTSTCQGGAGGGEAGQLNAPYGAAIDSSGNLYVADADNNRIDEFSSSGAFLKAFGWGVTDGGSSFETCTESCQSGSAAGGAAGQLNTPEGVAVGGDGTIYVAETDNSRIDEFSSSGAFVRTWGWGVQNGASSFQTCTSSCHVGLSGGGAGQVSFPLGIATSSSGDVYVGDANNNRIDEFSSSGAFVKAFGWGVADGGSHFETCTSSCQAGTANGGPGGLSAPRGLAVDGSDNLYVADAFNQRISEFDSAGSFVRAFGYDVVDNAGKFENCTTTCQSGTQTASDGAFSYPPGVAADSSGDVYVADLDNARVQKFTQPQHTLTVSDSGAGSGTVTSSPTGISCGLGCSQPYDEGAKISLSATPAGGSVFTGWSGACSGTGSCQVTMGSDQSVTATFGVDHNLTVSKAGTGSGTVSSSPAGVSCGSTCSSPFADGTPVTLTATADPGSAFVGWGEACSGTKSTCMLTMSADQSASATFRDATRPTATAPVQRLLHGSQLGASTVPVRLAWTAADNETPAAQIQSSLQEETRSGGTWSAWQTIAGPTTARSATISLAPGTTLRRLRIVAADGDGNVGASPPGPAFRTLTYQESSSRISYSGAWVAAAESGALGGSVEYSIQPGSSATITFKGRNTAVVAPLRSSEGAAKICLDPGTMPQRCRTVDLSPSSGLGPRKIVFASNGLAPTTQHQIQITDVSGRVELDAFTVLG